jgi:uncharacterized membrane protein
MKSKTILFIYLGIMVAMIIAVIAFPAGIANLLDRPELYSHVLFVHILATTLFFANAVVGILWELRSLVADNSAIILHTYSTVSWLDARFSSLLIVISTMSGIMLSLSKGDIWQVGWLSNAFLLFLLSGVVWVISDIPTQYRVKRLTAELDPDAEVVPEELKRILKMRVWISLAGVAPLAAVFVLMVYKPPITAVAYWFSG